MYLDFLPTNAQLKKGEKSAVISKCMGTQPYAMNFGCIDIWQIFAAKQKVKTIPSMRR